MSDLFTLLNHLTEAALAQWKLQRKGQGAVQVRGLILDPEGARLVLWLEHPQARGEAVFRIQAEAADGEKQTLRLTLLHGPAELGPLLEPFRKLLEKAKISIELDFSP
ncbi:MAG: hypothetical protein V3S64_18005 [bacterium]|jgi:hypothetical protein